MCCDLSHYVNYLAVTFSLNWLYELIWLLYVVYYSEFLLFSGCRCCVRSGEKHIIFDGKWPVCYASSCLRCDDGDSVTLPFFTLANEYIKRI